MHARKQSHAFLQGVVQLKAILSILLTSVIAAFVPTPVYDMASATIGENTFFVQGGGNFQSVNSTISISQFMSVALTLSGWGATNPPWQVINIPSSLAATTMATMLHSMSVSPNGQILTFWDPSTNGSVTSFNRTSGSWTIIDIPDALLHSEKDLKAVTNPNTSLIYFPLGFDGHTMLVCDPTHPTPETLILNTTPWMTDTISPSAPAGELKQVVMPDAVKRGATGYSFIWNSFRESLLLFGGRVGVEGSAGDPYFHEYNTVDEKWNVLVSLS
jgi:hypothetical protein